LEKKVMERQLSKEEMYWNWHGAFGVVSMLRNKIDNGEFSGIKEINDYLLESMIFISDKMSEHEDENGELTKEPINV